MALRPQITSSWIKQYYIYCPNATAAYAPDSRTVVASESPAGACSYGLSGDTCNLQCASGSTPVAGSAALTCMRGAWAGHPLVCGGTCPALPAPLTAASCTRFLQVCACLSRTVAVLGRARTHISPPLFLVQWEPFAPGALVNDAAISSHWPRASAVPTTLYRLSAWPLVPDVTLTDFLTLVNASSAPSVLSNLSATVLPSDASGSYSPLAVWAARDQILRNAVPVVGGSGATGSASGFLRVDTTFEPQVRRLRVCALRIRAYETNDCCSPLRRSPPSGASSFSPPTRRGLQTRSTTQRRRSTTTPCACVFRRALLASWHASRRRTPAKISASLR